MRFIDEAKIQIKAGHGGPGCISFRREKYVPRGGPDGGDGGRGGSVTFRVSSQMGTLQDFRYKRIHVADNGKPGSGNNKVGRSGEDLEIKVPVGTRIKNADTGETLYELEQDGEVLTICKGGRGGKGNAHFATATFQAPKFSQPGEEGESLNIQMELRLLADVGIIGLPNAGKSTLISRVSAAKPKIADYPFTTLVPNLGVVQLNNDISDLRTAVFADIPGLVEGAHRGAGLGHDFLRHIEKTRLFIHVLDGNILLERATRPDFSKERQEEEFETAVEDMVRQYTIIRRELGLFNETLLRKPEILVLNKADVLSTELIQKTQSALKEKIFSHRETAPHPQEPFAISAVSGTGMKELLIAVDQLYQNGPVHTALFTSPEVIEKSGMRISEIVSN